MLRIGHRGAAALAPENTIAAARARGRARLRPGRARRDRRGRDPRLAHSLGRAARRAGDARRGASFLAPTGRGDSGRPEGRRHRSRHRGRARAGTTSSSARWSARSGPRSLRLLHDLEPELARGLTYPEDRHGLSTRRFLAAAGPYRPRGHALGAGSCGYRGAGRARARTSPCCTSQVVTDSRRRALYALDVPVFAWTGDLPPSGCAARPARRRRRDRRRSTKSSMATTFPAVKTRSLPDLSFCSSSRPRGCGEHVRKDVGCPRPRPAHDDRSAGVHAGVRRSARGRPSAEMAKPTSRCGGRRHPHRAATSPSPCFVISATTSFFRELDAPSASGRPRSSARRVTRARSRAAAGRRRAEAGVSSPSEGRTASFDSRARGARFEPRSPRRPARAARLRPWSARPRRLVVAAPAGPERDLHERSSTNSAHARCGCSSAS